MKKIITGIFLLSIWIPSQILIADYLIKKISPSDGALMLLSLFGIFAILFQLIIYGSLIVAGYKEKGINNPF